MALPAILAAIPVIGKVLESVFGIIDKSIEDKDRAAELKAAIQMQVMQMDHTEIVETLKAQRDIVVEEAKGAGILQRNWRPITMLTFVALVVARWMGWTVPGITEPLELKLMNIIEIGLGGYVIGRSAEKIATSVVPMLKK